MGHSPAHQSLCSQKNPLPGYYQNIPRRVHKQRSLYITNPQSAQLRGEIPEIYHIFALFDPSDMGNVMIPKWEPDLTLALPAGYKRFMQNSPQTWRTQHQAHKKLEVKQNKKHTHTQHGWLLVFLQIPQGFSQILNTKKANKSQALATHVHYVEGLLTSHAVSAWRPVDPTPENPGDGLLDTALGDCWKIPL